MRPLAERCGEPGMLKVALFDLDNTLYSEGCGLWEAIGLRITQFMTDRLGLAPEEAIERRRRYRRSFGTTLNGLRHDFQVNPEEFLSYAHDLPLEQYLSHDAALDSMLAGLPLRKVIFTNADEQHAQRVLSSLGIERHFPLIVDIRVLDFVAKPDPRAYHQVLDMVSAEPQECILAEDTSRNLCPARELGMRTVLVGDDGSEDCADFRIPTITGLPAVVASVRQPGGSA